MKLSPGIITSGLVLQLIAFSAIPQAHSARPQPLTCQITQITASPDLSADPACDAAACTTAGGSVTFTGSASGGSQPYLYLWQMSGGDPFESSNNPATAVYNSAGRYNATFTVTDDRRRTCNSLTTVRIIGSEPTTKSINSTSQNAAAAQTQQVLEHPLESFGGFQVLATNDLGMHCADLDYQVFSILPPFNVVHAQVIQKGTGSTAATLPQILTNADVDVVYSSSSNGLDPALQNPPTPSIFKTNFWDTNPASGNPYGFDAYDPLYPPGVLGLFPLDPDKGLPVPDVAELYLGSGQLVAGQQDMPGISIPYEANVRQHFDRFDVDFPFFINFPFGYTVTGGNWFAADGIPIMPVDDQGRPNAYPLMRIQAIDKTGRFTGTAGTVLASTDTVLPVASEADCQICHADQSVCDPISQVCDGIAATFASVNFDVITDASNAPGNTIEQQVLNAAKINVLRLHDAKHNTNLDNARPVVCANCHYSPALDLAQVGPSDDNGKEQTRHISMSRAMHKFHGDLTFLGEPVFPSMPPPGSNPAARLTALEQTCYTCHPGKKTECLRGAMFNGGMLCQDCHGDMQQVGNDFTENFPTTPFPAGADLSKRVPWASEPGCQSCHTGDSVDNIANDANVIAAADGIRLLQAYRTDDPDATPIKAVNQRFAEDQDLYRLSKGHGGVGCQNCHGSTHAIWPVSPRSGPFVANDNVTATQLQGHDGKIQECDVCHERDGSGDLTMPLGLDGPHGLHPVNDNRWNLNHKNFTGGRFANCRTCHGVDLTGTVLSLAAAERVLVNKAGEQVTFPVGHSFGCGDCHKQK